MTAVDTFTEAMRVIVYIGAGIALLWGSVELELYLWKRHRRRAWWRSQSHGE